MPVPISLKVNGKAVTADVDPSLSLVSLLREQLGLTGTHVGCDTAQCGACTVHIEGRAVKSCNVLAVQLAGAEVTTIEGITPAEGMVYVPDADAAFARALAAGCTQVRPVEDQFYGDRTGTLKDPYGYQWSLGTHIEDVSEAEGQKRMEAMFAH